MHCIIIICEPLITFARRPLINARPTRPMKTRQIFIDFLPLPISARFVEPILRNFVSSSKNTSDCAWNKVISTFHKLTDKEIKKKKNKTGRCYTCAFIFNSLGRARLCCTVLESLHPSFGPTFTSKKFIFERITETKDRQLTISQIARSLIE